MVIRRPIVGPVVWLVTVALLRPTPFRLEWPTAIVLLAPLVIVPLALPLIRWQHPPSTAWRLALRLQFPSALALVVAYLLPIGWLAAMLALPWLVVTGLLALVGLQRIRRRGLRPWSALVSDAALLFVSIGAAAALLNRVGISPLGFPDVIILLTVPHFHYAGFVLPLLTGLAAQRWPGVLANLAALGVMVGVGLVFVGITASQLGFSPLIEAVAVTVMALAGLLTAVLHLRLALDPAYPALARVLWTVAGLSLAVDMGLALLYGLRPVLPILWLTIPWMWATHGTANALGFGLLGVIGWRVADRTPS